jgi:hypothetical protein
MIPVDVNAAVSIRPQLDVVWMLAYFHHVVTPLET